MRYVSTRGAAPGLRLSAALLRGLAPDGGLYVPAEWPCVVPEALAGSFRAAAGRFLAPFAGDDELAGVLDAVAREAFDFPVPLLAPEARGEAHVLELFHGPTAAFKDFGARFLAAALARLRAPGARPLRILVATSGDTGGAVAAAFHGRPGVEVLVLYPLGRISPLQERQLALGGNVRALAVRGGFDDCQRLVKAVLAEPAGSHHCLSANSINLGRLLPQAAYHAWASQRLAEAHGAPVSFVIPSGNLGNAVACLWARRAGMPIARVVLAHNANRSVPDFLASGVHRARDSVATLASAMDVGDPSNLERLRVLHPDLAALREEVEAVSIDDAAIRARLAADAARGRLWCPHSAVAAEAFARLPSARRAQGPWVLVATAHPGKFAELVLEHAGRAPELPPTWTSPAGVVARRTEIAPDLAALRAELGEG